MNEIEKEAFENNFKETQKCIDHLVRITKWLVILSVVSILSVVAVHGMTLLYLYQYDFSVETTTTTETVTLEQDASDGGNTNYINGDGDITNGEANGKNH